MRALPLGQFLDEAGARWWKKVRRTAPLSTLRRHVAHVLRTVAAAQDFGRKFSSDES